MNATISAITALQKYSISKATLKNHLYHNPVIPQEFRPALKTYYLLYWSPDWYFEKLHDGIICDKNGTSYIVITAPNVSTSKLLAANQIAMSFRQAMPEYELPGIVFVSIPSLSSPN